MPKSFDEVVDDGPVRRDRIIIREVAADIVDGAPSSTTRPGRPDRRRRPNLLTQETVDVTVFAQDPIVRDALGPILARIPVPADRLQTGPRSHRFHVVDISAVTGAAEPPVALHDGDPWVFVDEWAESSEVDAAALATDRKFRAQNLFAIASHTLALFEQHLGRPIPWASGYPHLYLVPQARVEPNAFYSPDHNAVFFGWLPAHAGQPAVYSALSFDIVAHEVSHAILDGLRPRYTEPGPPDQLAFHEALADLVAMLSVFDLPGVVEHLLKPTAAGKVSIRGDRAADRIPDDNGRRAALAEVRAAFFMDNPITGLAEQLGDTRRTTDGRPPQDGYPALRRSVKLPADHTWKNDPAFAEPHRRAEVLVAAFMHTLVRMWAERIDPLRIGGGGLDVERVAEEGTKAAQHLLGMLLRALDYLPPVEVEFPDILDAVITADKRLAPNDEHHYRDALESSFAAFGIRAPVHHIVDEDGAAAPRSPANCTELAGYPPDPDTTDTRGLRYEHLNFVALRTSPEEVYQFIWSNAALLGIDVRFTTRVERVLATTRVGPDGLVVNEIVADYIQKMRATADRLPPGIRKPRGMPGDAIVTLWGGGVLVFDQFGRFRLHRRQPLLDTARQNRRLKHLFDHGLKDRNGGYGSSDGIRDRHRFALLHRDSEVDA